MSGPALADWLERLSSFSPNEIDLGLERIAAVYRRMGAPRAATVLTVAGTNGKGSTVAYLDAFLRVSGHTVGAYTSPHLHTFNERVSVGDSAGKRLAGDAELVAAFERVEAARRDVPLTYFEYSTLAALAVFESAAVDAAVLEVGLGGRLDAVNVVDSDAAIVTNVALDHCDWLGDSIAEIAFEKAGVFRGNRPAIFGDDRGAPDALLRQAEHIGAALTLAGRDYSWRDNEQDWSWYGAEVQLEQLPKPALAGAYQLANAAGALAMLESVGQLQSVERPAIDQALLQIEVPARMQRFRAERDWLFDVAHNPAAAQALADTVPLLGGEPATTIAILGMLDDKDIEAVVKPLCTVVDSWVAITAESERAVPAAELARRVSNLSNKPCLVAGSPDIAVSYATDVSTKHDRVIVTGSFFAVGPVQRALGLYSPSPRAQ